MIWTSIVNTVTVTKEEDNVATMKGSAAAETEVGDVDA